MTTHEHREEGPASDPEPRFLGGDETPPDRSGGALERSVGSDDDASRLGTEITDGSSITHMPSGIILEDGIRRRVVNGEIVAEVPLDAYVELRIDSTHNPDVNTLLLGRWAAEETTHIDVTKRDGACYFDLGERWDVAEKASGIHSRESMFDLFNRPALDDAIRSDKEIRFSHDPFEDVSGRHWEMERQYLESFGYWIKRDQAGGWIARR